MKPINGKMYPLWGQFIDRKEEWIGGELQDEGDEMDKTIAALAKKELIITTKILDIRMIPNGKESAYFRVIGEDFTCGSDVKYLGITGDATAIKKGWLTLSGYGNHIWRIKKATP